MRPIITLVPAVARSSGCTAVIERRVPASDGTSLRVSVKRSGGVNIGCVGIMGDKYGRVSATNHPAENGNSSGI